MGQLKLSVLDQSPAAQEKTQDHAIRESLALARHCDALGCRCYRVSERHSSASIVGRASGFDRLTAMALNPNPNAAENFPNQVQELGWWLRGEPLPQGHPFREIRAQPQGPTIPPHGTAPTS